MSLQCRKLYFVVLAFQILIQTTLVECRPKPEPKPGFFGSVMGGAAGSVIGKMIGGRKSEQHHHHYHGPPATTIERRETLANGCYKQIVREPDTYSPGRFTETEQLICPPNAQAAQVPVMMPTQMNGSVAMQPMAPGYNPQQVVVLSRKTGSYGYNSGNRLLNTGVVTLIALALFVHFI